MIAPPDRLPCFLDFEASSLTTRSYPIQVAWSLEDGSIESHIINPAHVRGWDDWDDCAEDVHGFTREFLIKNGEHPSFVRDRLLQALGGNRVYTDAVGADGFWLNRLLCFDGAPPRATVFLEDFYSLFSADAAQNILSIISDEARRRVPGQHRADWDVLYLREFWSLYRSNPMSEFNVDVMGPIMIVDEVSAILLKSADGAVDLVQSGKINHCECRFYGEDGAELRLIDDGYSYFLARVPWLDKKNSVRDFIACNSCISVESDGHLVFSVEQVLGEIGARRV